MWNEIKDEFVHLKPRTPSHLEVSLKGMDDKLLQMFSYLICGVRLLDGHFIRIPHGADDDHREDAPHFILSFIAIRFEILIIPKKIG